MKTHLISSAKKKLFPASFRLIMFAMILFLSFLGSESFAQGVGISESAITPDANAILELRSTVRGFLAPRLTTSQRTTLGSIPPSNGMLVYDSQLNTFYYWNGAWVAISAGAVANGLTLTPLATGFSIAGGTISKTLTLNNTLGFSGTDNSTLNIGTGGTLGTNAYTSTAYAPLASPTFTGTVTIPTPFTLGATSVTSTGTQLNYLTAATGTTGTTSTNLVFSTSPTLVSPVLGAATGTSLSVTGQLTSTVATGTAPLVVTSTTPVSNLSIGGSAAKWTTARNLAGNSVDGSANVAFLNKFIVQGTTDAGLTGAQFLGALGTGIVKNTTTTGVLSIAANSDLPIMSATLSGAVPTPPNNTTTFLRGDGTWGTPTGTGVSSFNAGTTGFTPNSASTGIVTLAGTLNISNGGTGQTTQQAAINALSGTQTAGTYLRSDGTNASLSAIQAADVTGTLTYDHGGTGVNTFGGTNTLLFTTSANNLSSIATSNNGVLVTNATGVPSISTTGILLGVRVLTSGTSYTYTPTTGTNAILVKVVGGGGGGGGMASCASNAGASGGGGAGGYSERYYTTAGKTFIYSVGFAGIGGVAGANGNTVTPSTASTFTDQTTQISGGAGTGGSTMATGTGVAFIVGGTGGASSGGLINIQGSDGGFGMRISGTCVFSGAGGTSILGPGGIGEAAGATTLSVAGNAGGGYGAGGSGAANLKTSNGSAGAANGGNGSAGVVIIYEFK